MGFLDRIKGKKKEEEIPEFGPGDLDLGADFGAAPGAPTTPGTMPKAMPKAPYLPGAQSGPALPPLEPTTPFPEQQFSPSFPPPPEPAGPGWGFPQPTFPDRPANPPDDTSKKLDMILDRLAKVEERISYLERALYGQR
jgi:hypothetical protein